MTLRPTFLALTMVLAAGAAPGALAKTGGEPATVARLVAAPRLDLSAAARLYRDAVIANRVPALYDELERVAASSAVPERRSMALLARAAMRWQQGTADAALADADRALTLHSGPAALLLKARLLDAGGHATEAVALYRQAQAATSDAAERRMIAIRIAVAEATTRPAALVDLTRATPPAAMPGRVATTLALLGDPAGALALAPATGTSDYAQDLRLADRAIAAKRFDAARDHAWRAFGHADGAADRRYALAVMVEAYRAAGTLAEAETFLAAHTATPDIDQARVDLLLELGRTDAAVALIDRSGDATLRARLLPVFEMTGRDQDVATEYRRRIAAQPDRLEWVGGLALHHLGRGDDAAAIAVYRQFFTANAGRIDALTTAARQMIAMGLGDAAHAMIERATGGGTGSVPLQFFLFEAAQGQGDDAAARAALARLRTLLPPASPLLSDVADGYERLGDPAEALAVLHAAETRGAAADYDQRVHIALLAFATGRFEESLTRWRALWRESKLPARRSYLERQIVRSATRLDRLEPIARELEAAIAAGRGGQGEIDLLVGIRLAQGRGNDAVAVVRSYAQRAGLGDIARLEQLAALYVRLRDRPALNRTLRLLVRADPANADLYLRRLTLNIVRYAEGDAASQAAEVERLLAELRGAAGLDDADATRFAAGVYAMASLGEQAAAQYRRAMALAPDDSDAMIQLANLLKTGGKPREAVAMLQFAADFAADESALTIAIDALVDTVAAPANVRDAAEAAPLRATVLAWARRRVLGHIVAEGSGIRIDTTLADLAQEQGDFALQRRAYDDMLALAGDQKAAVLRQLLVLTSGTAGREEDAGPALGDGAAKVAYGRRLLALRREYPADFYADLARSMLAAGDVAGAERAFAMMHDVGGLVNVDQVRGDAYAKAGRPEQALREYGRALLRDRDDAGLIVKASILREQRGEAPLANRWYWQGLRTLILRQPLHVDTTGEVPIEVRQYLPTLTEGLLLTWPDVPADAARILTDLRAMVADAARQVEPGTKRAFVDHPRLTLLVALDRRIAERQRDTARIAALDALLAPRFGHDPSYLDSAALWRDLTGIRPVDAAARTGEDWIARGLQAQARDGGNADLDLVLTLARGDAAGIAAWMDHAIASETIWRDAARRGDTIVHPPLLYAMLLKGGDALSPAMLRTLVLEPVARLPFRDEVMFDLFRTAPDRFARLATIAPDLVPGDDALMAMMGTRTNLPLPIVASSARRTEDVLGGMLARFSVDALIGLYERLVATMLADDDISGFQDRLIGTLLRRPLDAGQQARLLAAIRRDIAYPDPNGRRSAGRIVPTFLIVDPVPANRAVLLDAAQALAVRYPLARQLAPFLRAVFADDDAAAFAALRALDADTATEPGGADFAGAIFRERFQEEVRRDMAAFLNDPAPAPDRIVAFHRDYVLNASRFGIGSAPATALPLYRKLASVDPATAAYRLGLVQLLWDRGDRAEATAMFRPYVTAHPDEPDAAAMLQMMLATTDQPDAARAVAQASGVSIDDPAALAATVNRMGSQRGDLARTFAPVLDAYRARFPAAPAIVALDRQRAAQQQRSPTLVAEDDIARQQLVAAFAVSPERGRAVLRDLWRNSMPLGDQPTSGAVSRGGLTTAVALPAAGTATTGPVAAILAAPAVIDDLTAMLAALEPEVRQRQPGLYALVAQGLIDQGRARARIDASWRSVDDGTIGGHDLHLLLTLVERIGDVPDPARRAAIVRRLQAMPVLSAAQRVQLATLFARAGDHATAGALLEAATMQALLPTTLDMNQSAAAIVSPRTIVATLETWQDRAAAARTRAAIVARVTAEQGEAAAAALSAPPG